MSVAPRESVNLRGVLAAPVQLMDGLFLVLLGCVVIHPRVSLVPGIEGLSPGKPQQGKPRRLWSVGATCPITTRNGILWKKTGKLLDSGVNSSHATCP